MRTRCVALLLALLASLGVGAHGGEAEGDAIVGQWLTQDKDAHIEIYCADGKYHGKFVWLRDPTYPKGDPEYGKPVHDRKNPDPAKRELPILGSTLLTNFEYAGDHRWKNGSLYNAQNGKTYKARLLLDTDDSLKVRGYVGISLLGETTVWTRIKAPGSPEGNN